MKKKNVRRMIALLLVLTLILPTNPFGYGVTIAKADTATVFAYYPFRGDTKDYSGNGYDGTIVGNATYDSEGGIKLSNSTSSVRQNYVSLDSGILTKMQDSNALTISAWVKNGASGNNKTSVFTFGASDTYFFGFTPFNWGLARSSFYVGSEVTGIQYNTANNVNSPTSGWYQITITLEDVSSGSNSTKISYYKDGVFVCSVTSAASVSALGELSFVNIGAGMPSSNYYDFIGSLRDIKFYSSVLSTEEVANTYVQEQFDLVAAEICDSIGADFQTHTVTLDQDVTLPTTGSNSATISWATTDENVITTDGVITKPSFEEGDVVATLTATIAIGGVEKEVPFTVTVEKEMSAAEKIAAVKDSLNLPITDGITGNITLPTKNSYGVTVTWTSSNPSVVSTEEIAQDGYDAIPAGVVTRQDTDTNVTLTANLSLDGETDTKEFATTVKAKSSYTTADNAAYLFAYFKGEGLTNGEQIYFATSENGLDWVDLNEGAPVLTSTLGECGVRDPFIIRSAEGDKFYLIATDLKINGRSGGESGNVWTDSQVNGSQSIMIWESEDLVNWSEPRLTKIAADNAGCTWAPEIFYDKKTGEYVVFWSSKTSDDSYSKQRVYYCKTRDFYTFTEPELWIELKGQSGETLSAIDASVISVENGDGSLTYYRFYKNEDSTPEDGVTTGGKYTIVEKSDSMLGTWTRVSADVLKENQYVEGGTCFKFNGENRWCLLLDNFGGGGYYPLVTTDLASGSFTKLTTDEYSFPSTMRHGTVMNITRAEYDTLMEKWDLRAKENTEAEVIEPVISYDFNETLSGTNIADQSGNSRDGELFGNATYVTDAEKGQVLYLDGTTDTYAALPTGFFDGRNKFSVSFDVKAETSASSGYFTFGIGKNSDKYLFLKTTSDTYQYAITKGSWSGEQTLKATMPSTIQDVWHNVKLVVNKNVMSLYIDGALKSTVNDITTNILDFDSSVAAYLGKSFYSGDGYYKGYYDNFKVYNRELTKEEIHDEYYAKVSYTASEGGTIEGTLSQDVRIGTNATSVKAVPNYGYVFRQWSDGVTTATRQDTNVVNDLAVTAEFERETVTLTYTASEGGYIEGEAVQVVGKGTSGSEVRAVASGSSIFVKWSDDVTTASRTDTNVMENKSVTAIFTEGNEGSIELTTLPDKTIYQLGDTLNLAGIAVTIHYADGSERTTSDLSEITTTGFDSSILGQQNVVITVAGMAATFSITVVDVPMVKEIVGICVKKNPSKSGYKLGEEFVIDGLEITAFYNDRSEADIIDTSLFTITGFDSTTAGTKKLTVTYEGKEATFFLYVVDPNSSNDVVSGGGSNGGSGGNGSGGSGDVIITIPSNPSGQETNEDQQPLSTEETIQAGRDVNATMDTKVVDTNVVTTITLNQQMLKEAITNQGQPVELSLPVANATKLRQELEAQNVLGATTKIILDKAYLQENDDVIVKDLVATAEVLKVLKNTKKALEIKVVDETGTTWYAWNLNGDQMLKSNDYLETLNLVVSGSDAKGNASVQKTLEEDKNNTTGYVISFDEKATLPSGSVLRVNVKSQLGLNSGDAVYVYRFNEETGKFESNAKVRYIVDEDGMINTNLKTKDTYVILTNKASTEVKVTLKQQISLSKKKATIAKGKSTTIQVNLPDTIALVPSFQASATEQYGEETAVATVSYQSNNKKVATVNKNGKVVGKKAGKATITVTVTFENGTKYRYTTKVTVK
ncbi:immunoglobulin-like domain-containing protein [Anaerosporobacter faecicola]|uniref:immunoglobulin-like domain-containing protein n=1 Tax=Anaerosporobacter faecicola TaxID=2718714 RepID=UPI00143AE366|nr:immunoglobulin-like domain-containing protein [Anaerosporobacter faecicola]